LSEMTENLFLELFGFRSHLLLSPRRQTKKVAQTKVWTSMMITRIAMCILLPTATLSLLPSLPPSSSQLFRKLGQKLDLMGYNIAGVAPFFGVPASVPGVMIDHKKVDRTPVDIDINDDNIFRIAVLLLTLSVPIRLGDDHSVAARDFLSNLSKLGLVTAAESGNPKKTTFTPRFHVTPTMSPPCVHLTDLHPVIEHDKNSVMYIGPDTLAMARNIGCVIDGVVKDSQNRGKIDVLDMCCGSGVQGIIFAKMLSETHTTQPYHVTFADVNRRALHFTSLNAALNGLKPTQSSCILSDVFDDFPTNNNNLYDLIVANPPYVPVPSLLKDSNGLYVGGGGLDGSEVLRRVLIGSREKLHEGGKLSIVTEICNPDTLLSNLKRELRGFCGFVFVNDVVVSPGEYAKRKSGEQDALREIWESHLEAQCIRGVSVALFILKKASGREGVQHTKKGVQHTKNVAKVFVQKLFSPYDDKAPKVIKETLNNWASWS